MKNSENILREMAHNILRRTGEMETNVRTLIESSRQQIELANKELEREEAEGAKAVA